MKVFVCSLFLLPGLCWADTSALASQLQNSASATSRAISSNVESSQAKQNAKLSIQLKIDALGARLGSVNDIEDKIQLEKQLKQLQQQKQSL